MIIKWHDNIDIFNNNAELQSNVSFWYSRLSILYIQISLSHLSSSSLLFIVYFQIIMIFPLSIWDNRQRRIWELGTLRIGSILLFTIIIVKVILYYIFHVQCWTSLILQIEIGVGYFAFLLCAFCSFHFIINRISKIENTKQMESTYIPIHFNF